jgi:hypothetical protein
MTTSGCRKRNWTGSGYTFLCLMGCHVSMTFGLFPESSMLSSGACNSEMQCRHMALQRRCITALCDGAEMAVFDKIFAGLATDKGIPEQLQIDATHLKAHRTAASLLEKGLFLVVSAGQKAD